MRDDDSEYVELDGLIENVTEDAVLFDIDGDTYWIPRSVIKGGSDIEDTVDDPEDCIIEVKQWWVDKEGIEYE